MTTIHSVSDYGSISASTDLPLPVGSVETSCHTVAGATLSRPVTLANTVDSGRIRYGSCARLPGAR
jgi:hypothetical protein